MNFMARVFVRYTEYIIYDTEKIEVFDRGYGYQ
jgi:hypothetical protein